MEVDKYLAGVRLTHCVWYRGHFPGLTKIAESFGEVNAYVNSETGEVEA